MSETELDRRRCGVLPGAFRVAREKSENVAVDGRYCYWRWHTTSIRSVSRRAEEIDRALAVVARLKELVHSRFDPDDDDQDGGDDDDGRHTRRVRYTCAITFFRANYVSGVCLHANYICIRVDQRRLNVEFQILSLEIKCLVHNVIFK